MIQKILTFFENVLAFIFIIMAFLVGFGLLLLGGMWFAYGLVHAAEFLESLGLTPPGM